MILEGPVEIIEQLCIIVQSAQLHVGDATLRKNVVSLTSCYPDFTILTSALVLCI